MAQEDSRAAALIAAAIVIGNPRDGNPEEVAEKVVKVAEDKFLPYITNGLPKEKSTLHVPSSRPAGL